MEYELALFDLVHRHESVSNRSHEIAQRNQSPSLQILPQPPSKMPEQQEQIQKTQKQESNSRPFRQFEQQEVVIENEDEDDKLSMDIHPDDAEESMRNSAAIALMVWLFDIRIED